MKKVIGLIAGASLFLVAGTAMAANVSNVEWENGDTEIQGKGGETVDATLRIVVPAGEVVEMLQTDVISDGLGPICESVGGSRGLEQGTHYVDVEVKLPPNTGTYDLDVQASGIFGGQRSIDCEEDVVDDTTFNDSIRVVGSSNNNDDDDIEEFCDEHPGVCGGTGGSTGTTSSVCSQLSTKLLGTVQGIYNDANVSLQGFLLSWNPSSIPALKAGSTVPMGFFGPQTSNALSSFKTANSCN